MPVYIDRIWATPRHRKSCGMRACKCRETTSARVVRLPPAPGATLRSLRGVGDVRRQSG